MDDTTDVVGLLVSVTRELRRALKIAAYSHDFTLSGFAVAALEPVAANPDLLSLAEAED